MALSRNTDRKFLELHGNKWRVVVPVPRKAQAAIGKTKLRQALPTDSLAEANRLKWPVVANFQRQIDRALRPDDHLEKALHLAQQRRDAVASTGDAEPEENQIDDYIEEIQGPVIAEDEFGEPIYDPQREAAAHRFADIAYSRATPFTASRAKYEAQLKVAPRTKADDARAFAALIAWCEREGIPLFRETFGRREAVRFHDDFGASGGRHPVTLNKYMRRLSIFWKWMLRRDEVKTNVWQGLTYAVPHETDETEERPFTDDELKSLLRGPAQENMHDLMRLGALTGARLEVLVSLKVGDCLNGAIRFKAAKKEKGARFVPIHPDLVAIISKRTEGKSEEDHLFPEWPPVIKEGSLRERSFKASQDFTDYRRSVGVTDAVEGKRRERVNFHSFRRWFVTKAEQADQPESTIASIVGHKRQGMTLGVYSSGPKLDQARRCVEAVILPEVSDVIVLPSKKPRAQR
ncbi:tyrosine-type recombinase/integrase [Devosia sp. MC532]|uniref:tyrosine-type recombinase/integrase n=1 Tax=Devosia sp. MC532 TaxID=2799788 RepID=UPI0018F38B0F|nr:tyrosine-type recombinase/integrase [Devosia sp. MC532]MBJ7577285.1 tyrosine-type recombinase/integrase [Devosia sp. MC532]